jgi:hypothetical protein
MKKLILICTFVLSTVILYAQDTTKVNTSFTISSKNFWRGAVYGDNTPSVQGTLAVARGNFEIGAYGTSPLNGTSVGYGIWMEVYASYNIGRFNITVDDYFFFNEFDQDNDYFNWNHNSTQHLVEGRLKYAVEKFSLTGSYVVYAAEWSKNSLYFEGEYFLIPELSVLAGYVAGESYLNFYDDSGITHVGIAGNRKIKVTNTFEVPVKAALYASPNYEDIAELPGLRRNPINFVLTLSF